MKHTSASTSSVPSCAFVWPSPSVFTASLVRRPPKLPPPPRPGGGGLGGVSWIAELECCCPFRLGFVAPLFPRAPRAPRRLPLRPSDCVEVWVKSREPPLPPLKWPMAWLLRDG